MAKKKKADEEQQNDPVVAELTQEKPLLIVEGKISDDHCNSGYQINTGPTKGMVHGVKGKPLIMHDDLRNAFKEFKPHMAVLCSLMQGDADSFQDVDDRAEVDLCLVTGFKIKGAGESESISLIGSFHSMEANGRVEVSGTPYISLDGHDGYKWYNELRDTADKVRAEIELYHNGKCTPADDEPKEKPNYKIEFSESEDQI